MEVEVLKYNTKTKNFDSKSLIIESFTKVSEPNGLFIVEIKVDPIEIDKKDTDTEIWEVFKVQFIATCKSNLKQPFLAAFYVGENSKLKAKVITVVSEGYEDPYIFLVDYKAYEEICEFTKERKLTFAEYIKSVRFGRNGLNRIIKYRGISYNYDEQAALYHWLEEEGK